MPKTKRSFVYIIAMFFLIPPAFAQQQIKIGTDIPLQYGLGYKYSPDYGIGGGLKLGILSEPHSSIILYVMEAFGTKEFIVDIIRNSFKTGIVLDASADWHWHKNYFGADLVFINLRAGEAPLDVIDNHYGFDLIGYSDPLSSIFSQASMQINLQSYLMQFGIHYGRRILLNEKFELQLEVGVSKNMGSTNNFCSDYPYPQTIYSTIDEDLNEAYRKYAIIPTLGIYLVYNL